MKLLKTTRPLLVMLTSLALWLPSTASSLVLGPAGSDGDRGVSTTQQRAVLFTPKNGQHRVAFQTSIEAPEGASLTSLVWLVPLPAPPSSYTLATPELFDAFEKTARTDREPERSRAKKRRVGALKKDRVGVVDYPDVTTAAYSAKVFKLSRGAGRAELDAWLDERALDKPSDDAIAYYIEHEWSILALHATPKKGDATLDTGTLPAITLDYSHPSLTFPTKITGGVGNVCTEIFLVTDNPAPRAAFSSALDAGFEVASGFGVPYIKPSTRTLHGELAQATSVVSIEQLPPAARPLFKGLGFGPKHKFNVRVVYHSGSNRQNSAPAPPAQEVAFPPPKKGTLIMGSGEITPLGEGEVEVDAPALDVLPPEPGQKARRKAPAFDLPPPKKKPRQEEKKSSCQVTPPHAAPGGPGSLALFALLAICGMRRRPRSRDDR